MIFWFLSCSHANTTWPQTKSGFCSVSCLDCGASLEYDWSQMKIVRRLDSEPKHVTEATA